MKGDKIKYNSIIKCEPSKAIASDSVKIFSPESPSIAHSDNNITLFPPLGHSNICSNCFLTRVLASNHIISSEKTGDGEDVLNFLSTSNIFKSVEQSNLYHAILINPESNAVTTKIILPLPSCKNCYERRPKKETYPKTAIESLPFLESSIGGIISKIDAFELEIQGVSFPFWISRVKISTPYENASFLASGKGWDYEMAITKGISEALEHYSFSYNNYKDSSVKNHTNNGWAAHIDLAAANENSINELIERDSFLATWYSKKLSLGIDLSKIKDDYINYIIDRCYKIGFKLAARILKTDTSRYVVSCLLYHNNPALNIPCTILGLGCERKAIEAFKSSLSEALQMVPAISFHMNNPYDLKLEEKWSPQMHGSYYGRDFRAVNLQFLINSGDQVDINKLSTHDSNINKILKSSSISVEETTPVDLALLGFKTVHAKTNQLIDLHFHNNLPNNLRRRINQLYPNTEPHISHPHPLC